MDGIDESATASLRQVMPLAATWGLRVLSADEHEPAGTTRVALDAGPELETAGGVTHGGVLMALADSAGALCAFGRLPEGASGTSTVASATSFVGAARGGTVVATASPLHVGRSTIVVETKVHDEAGRLLTSTTQTQAVLRSS
jgi:uncharacterized protein (TIGR00369 family)